ncbi:hypothetical protein [Flavobacterium sp. N3904]|uniref:hypothetical protein n=1 Tax=Flavobacterium sp. N3904 TaxID=2986835 RepID=UPI0022240558|nr:hypothetical protein [Flavobacterium sp. N3904]
MTSGNPTLIGTAGGTFLSIVPNLHSEDVLKTVLLAAIGAIVSFVLSIILKFIVKKHKKK